MHVYIKGMDKETNEVIYLVGFYRPLAHNPPCDHACPIDTWVTESVHSCWRQAARRVNWLNGGSGRGWGELPKSSKPE